MENRQKSHKHLLPRKVNFGWEYVKRGVGATVSLPGQPNTGRMNVLSRVSQTRNRPELRYPLAYENG